MRAADGAIEVIRIRDDVIELEVIGDTTPVGLCGSGLVDVVAELATAGLLDPSGRFVPNEMRPPSPHPRPPPPRTRERRTAVRAPLARQEGDFENAVYLSQRDVRELQFAKASIATGWSLLVEELGVDVGDIQQVLLAGSFGSYLSPASAIKIGLVPRLALPRIVSAGNVAGEGAKMAFLSIQERHAATAMFNDVQYVDDDIYSVRPAGIKLRRLTNTPGTDEFAPHYFGDENIVFSRGQSGDGPDAYADIYTMRENGSKVRPLVHGAGSAFVEDVAPSGHTLLFRRDQGLWVKPIGPGRARKLSELPDGSKTSSVFSSDSRSVAAFVATEGVESLSALDVASGRRADLAEGYDPSEGESTTIGPVIAWQPVRH